MTTCPAAARTVADAASSPSTDDLRDRLRAAMDALRPLEQRAGAEPAHWIGGDGDPSPSWCAPCAEGEVIRLTLAHQPRHEYDDEPAPEYDVDGGWEAHENDGPVYCAGCHRLLDYTLTDYGAGEELAHFLTNGLRVDSERLHPNTAYEVVAVLEAFEWGNRDLLPDAVRVGEAAAALAAGSPPERAGEDEGT